MMEISMDFKPSTVGHLPPPMPSPTNAPARKRAFSEVEDHNIPKPEAHKIQKFGEGEQENQDPLRFDHNVEIDKPIPSVANMDTNTTTDIPVAGNQSAQTATAASDAPSTNTSAATTVPIIPSTPPRQQPQLLTAPDAIANHPNKKLKLSPATKEAKRKEKEEKDRLRLEEKVKKEAEKKAKEEERKKKDAEKEEERKKRDAEREEKKKQKEEEKQAKEEEKRKKEEEKEKKDRVS